EVEHFADALARAPELHGDAQVDVEDEVDVGDWLARRRLAEGRKLSGAHTAGLDAAASRAGSEPSRCATTHAQSSKRRRLGERWNALEDVRAGASGRDVEGVG